MLVVLSVLLHAAHAGNVNQIGAGSWASAPVQVPGAVNQDHNVWVDLSVYDLAYEKDVGVRWTDDGWLTSHDADAWYEQGLGAGWEQWGVDIVPIGTRSTDGQSDKWLDFDGNWQTVGAPVTIEYAVYYRAAGGEWWDNNNGQNYSITLW